MFSKATGHPTSVVLARAGHTLIPDAPGRRFGAFSDFSVSSSGAFVGNVSVPFLERFYGSYLIEVATGQLKKVVDLRDHSPAAGLAQQRYLSVSNSLTSSATSLGGITGKIDLLRFNFQLKRSLPFTCLELVDIKTTHNLFLNQTLTRAHDRQSSELLADAAHTRLPMVQRPQSNQLLYHYTRRTRAHADSTEQVKANHANRRTCQG